MSADPRGPRDRKRKREPQESLGLLPGDGPNPLDNLSDSSALPTIRLKITRSFSTNC